MEQHEQTYRFTWQGIEIEAGYTPRKFGGVIAHLEIRSVAPERAPLPITETGYLSHFHECGTIEAVTASGGGGVLAQIIAFLDSAAEKPDWRRYVEASRQGSLF